MPAKLLVLASQSPRRKELLTAAGIAHSVRVADINESPHVNEDPVHYVRRIAMEKASAVHANPEELILAADTAVVCDDQILGKPVDLDDARRMLLLLSGRRHLVLTGVALRNGTRHLVDHESTAVWFSVLTAKGIEGYIATGEPMDKAGAYAIQGIASRYITRIEGNYSNVVGLPVSLVWNMLAKIAVA